MKATTIFFCYAWEETDRRYEVLKYIRKRVIQKARDREPIEVILDRHTYAANANFNELREKIKSYDLVVVFCTPDLKEIIADADANKNKDREVLKEYKIIKERFEEDNNTVFPVILEGNKENALLPIFSSLNVQRFETYNLSQNARTKRFFIPRDKEAEFGYLLRVMIANAICNSDYKSEEYKDKSEALYKLFGLTDNANIPNSCLVKQSIYNKINEQTCCFIVGRKGSGKSTFIKRYCDMDKQYFNSHYKKLLPIKIMDFQPENVYESLIKSHLQDSAIIDKHAVLCLFWEVYIVLNVICSVCREIDGGRSNVSEPRYSAFKKMGNKLKQKMGVNENTSFKNRKIAKGIFNAAIEMVDNQYSYAVSQLKEGELIVTSFSTKFNLTDILIANFGKKIVEKFFDALSQCEKKVLIAVDGFDTNSDEFTKTTIGIENKEEHDSRRDFETMFYRTLIEVVTQFKDKDTREDYTDIVADVTHFCVILPKDKYDSIIDDDRDSFKKTFSTMSWTAYELMRLLIKRLGYIIKIVDSNVNLQLDNEDIPLEDRMDKALSFFSGLPTKISMTVNGNVMEMSLFNYILRNSFWRPRDVISNLFYIMIKAMEKSDIGRWSSKKESLSDEVIKRTIKDNCDRIIKDEFIGEYKYVFRNLEQVLRKLQTLDEQIEVSKFKEIIKGIAFDTAFSYDMNVVNYKLQVLYQLGVIGFLFKKEFADHQHYNTHICFEFNEGMTPFNDYINLEGAQMKQEVYVVFNPIFSKWCLIHYNMKELLGNWDSKYYELNQIDKDTIHRL